MKLRITAGWHLPMTDEAIEQGVVEARRLGFNAYAWTSDEKEAEFVAASKKYGIKAFKVLEPLVARPNAVLQELDPGEELLPGMQPVGEAYQYGGEPAEGHREVLDQPLVCPSDPSVMDFAEQCIREAKELGYDGVCWDFIGYRNYHSCCCKLCSEKLREYLDNHSNENQAQSEASFYENILIKLYSSLYDMVKEIDPEMMVMSHCHPIFLPNHFYGLKTKVDYCGITVSWFFKPHWHKDKVRKYIRKTVEGPYAYPQTVGMPMIGFYGSEIWESHRRSGADLRQDLEIVKNAGADAFMLCELGNILQCEDASEAVRTALAPFPQV